MFLSFKFQLLLNWSFLRHVLPLKKKAKVFEIKQTGKFGDFYFGVRIQPLNSHTDIVLVSKLKHFVLLSSFYSKIVFNNHAIAQTVPLEIPTVHQIWEEIESGFESKQ